MRFVFYNNFKPGLVKDDKVVDISEELKVEPDAEALWDVNLPGFHAGWLV